MTPDAKQPSRNKIVERYEDMSPDGRLRLLQQEDGDVIVAIVPASDSRRPMVEVEFCSCGAGGGQSPKTLEALRNLITAMHQDNIESEQYRDDSRR